MHDVANGKLRDLAADGARMVGHLNDLLRHMVGRDAIANSRADLLAQRVIEPSSRGQADEENDTHVGRSLAPDVLPDHETPDPFIELFHLPVDLRRTDADA